MKECIKLPDYFKTHGCEDFFKKSPFAYGLGLGDLNYYEAISHDQDRFNIFNMTMNQVENNVPILGMYPFGSLNS